MQGYCGKVVIDAFDPGLLKSPYTCLPIDFSTADENDLLVCCCVSLSDVVLWCPIGQA